MEAARVQLLRQHVADVIVRPHERHHELHRLDHIADVEVPPLNMLRALMVLGVVREVARCLVVSRAARGATRRLPQACEQLTKVNQILSPLGEGIDLGFASAQGRGGLLRGGPRNSGPLSLDVIPRGRATLLEGGVVKPLRLTRRSIVREAYLSVTL